MPILVFESSLEPGLVGFTRADAGYNLPSAFAPWTQTGRIPPGTEVGDALLAGLLRNGFYLSRGGVELVVPRPP